MAWGEGQFCFHVSVLRCVLFLTCTGADPLEFMILGFAVACVAAVLLSGVAAVGFAVAEPTKRAVENASRMPFGAMFLRALAATTGNNYGEGSSFLSPFRFVMYVPR